MIGAVPGTDGADGANAPARHRVLVTGGAGFIGSHLVRSLRDSGVDVAVADLVRCGDRCVTSTMVDLRTPGAVERVLRPGVDAVVHLAAATSVLKSIDHPAETFATNVAVTSDLLERARQIGATTFVFASSNAVAGGASLGPLSEHSALAPLTPYGATKAAAEMLVSAYHASYGVRGTSLRFTNVYGPGMGAKDSVIPRLMRAAASGETFEVFGDGRQSRDFLYVGDVVAAIRLALSGGTTRDVHGPIVVGSGVSTSIVELVSLVREVTGVDVAVRHVAPKPGEMARVIVDTSRAQALGWRAGVGLEEGLSAMWGSWGMDLAGVAGRETADAGVDAPPTVVGL